MWSRISTKVIFAVGGIATLIIGLFAYMVLNTHQQHLIADLERQASQLSETVKSSTRYSMLLNEREHVYRIINTVGRQEGIEKVRIFNKEGVIILSTDSLDVGQMVDQRAEACFACHAADQPLERLSISERTRIFSAVSENRTLGIIDPIYNERSCWESECHAHEPDKEVLGVLDITMSLAEIDRERRANEMQILFFTILTIAAMSLIIDWVITRIVLKPVGQITKATQNVASGDFNYAIPVKKNDEIGRLAASFNDMTIRLAEAQRQLVQSDKLASVGRLAAGVAHEINNPLTGVLTYSSFLLKRMDDKPELKEDLEIIVRETIRCREIVKGLLDFARQSEPVKGKIHVNQIINNAVSIVHNQLVLHKIQLSLNLQTDLPPIYADVNQVEQVFVNLLVNAGDSMSGKPGTITIETSLGEGEIEALHDQSFMGPYNKIVVRDTGSGIPTDDLAKVFEPFFTTKGQKGTGLGLAVVWGIIEKHHGRILVESDLGKGTTFTILFPVYEGA